jgi:hypothetical protein
MPEKSILDERLAEIDRRLRAIQSGLEPAARAEREARAPVVPPEAAPVPKRVVDLPVVDLPVAEPADASRDGAELVRRLADLVAAHERLLAAAREQADRGAPADTGPMLSVSAGPFAGTEALHRFQEALLKLPGVRRVAVREYEGADRAIVDVHLFEPNT